MSRKSKQHDKQFKLDAIKYVNEHPDLTQEECCKNLGIDLSTLARWKSQYLDNNGDIPTRGSGNYASFEYIETFYNTVRIHSHCDYMSPDQFEKLYQRVVA